MATELVLLLVITVGLIIKPMFGSSGPMQVFEQAGPKLSARIEQQTAIGASFPVHPDGSGGQWDIPETKSSEQL